VTVSGYLVIEGSWSARTSSTGSGASWARANLSSSQDQVYARIKFNVVSQGNNELTLLRLRTSGNVLLVSVFVTPQGRLGLRAGGSTFTSTTSVVKSTWNELELRSAINGGAGETEVWFNGQRIDALARSVNLGTAQIARVEIGDTATTRTFDIAVDDVLVSTGQIAATMSGPVAMAAAEVPTGTAVPPTVTPANTAISATSTPVPTPEPSPTDTPVPATATPIPTDTPLPTPAPVATDTPTPPTQTAVPIATP
jgi:hypothetical protein